MTRHLDILDEKDSLRGPFLGSLALHGGIVGLIVFMAWAKIGHNPTWGDPNSTGGGAYSVTAVKSIPMVPRTGPVNRLASDTKSQIPEPPKPEVKKPAVKEREDPDAIALKSNRNRKQEKTDRYASNRVDQRPFERNQVYSRTGQATVSPLFSQAPGSGGVGVGTGNPFGEQCGAYAALLRDRVAQRWKTDAVDGRIRTLPAAIVTFDLNRDGRVGNIRVVQTSGNYGLDSSAQRAVTEASPFEPIPPNCKGNPATIEFWFELKR